MHDNICDVFCEFLILDKKVKHDVQKMCSQGLNKNLNRGEINLARGRGNMKLKNVKPHKFATYACENEIMVVKSFEQEIKSS